MTKKIGLTGGIGSGKSFIAGVLLKMGYPVFFSDDFSKDIANTNVEVRQKLIALFGAEVYIDGALNRPFLAKMIFENEENRLKVNSIIHPKVRQGFEDWANRQTSEIVFNEAAIFFETGGHKALDATILVTAPLSLRIARVQQRDGVAEREVMARIEKQWSDEQKIPLADFVIENDEKTPLLHQLELMLSNIGVM
ncbi:MAG: dephospho-CoA kinase [Bacteroidota bacterium]